MSAATSPGTGLAYGLRRVCAAWEALVSRWLLKRHRRSRGRWPRITGISAST